MADTLKEYLIGVEFKMNEGDANRLQSMVNQLDGAIQSLNKNIASMRTSSASASAGMRQHASGASKAASSTRSLGSAARSAAPQIQQAGKHSQSAGLEFKKMGNQIKRATGHLKRYMNMIAGYVLGTSMKAAVKNAIDLAEGIQATAKELNKSVEDARAYKIALDAIGKSAEEIKKDENLKTTFEQLQTIGKEMALPEAAQGLKTIQRFNTELQSVKVTFSYAMQWIVYKVQELAKGPLKEIRDLMSQFRGFISNNIPRLATSFANHFGHIVQLISSAIQFVVMLVQQIDKLPESVKLAAAAFGVAFAAMRSKAALVTLIVGAILLLIDDLVTYMQGGESLFGSFWKACIDWGIKAKVAVDVISAKIKAALEGATDPADFVKRFVLGDDYEPDSSWQAVGAKVFDEIKKGFNLIGDWVYKLFFPNGTPETVEGDWGGLVTSITTSIAKHLTGANLAEFATGFIKALTDSLTTVDPETGKLSSTLLSLFGNVLDGIVAGITSSIGAGVDLVNTLGGLFAAIFSPENISAAFATLTDVGSRFVAAISDLIVNALNAANGIDFGGILGTGATAVSNIASGLLDSISKVLGSVKARDVGSAAIGLVKNIFTALKNALTVENFKQVWTSALDFGTAIVDLIADLFKGVDDQKLSAIDMGAALGAIIQNLFTSVADLDKDGALTTFIQNLGTKLGEMAKTAGDFAGDFVGELLASLFSAEGLANAKDFLMGIGRFIVEAILAGLEGASTFIGKFIETVWKRIYPQLPESVKSVLNAIGIVDPNNTEGNEFTTTYGTAEETVKTRTDLADAVEAFNRGDVQTGINLANQHIGDLSSLLGTDKQGYYNFFAGNGALPEGENSAKAAMAILYAFSRAANPQSVAELPIDQLIKFYESEYMGEDGGRGGSFDRTGISFEDFVSNYYNQAVTSAVTDAAGETMDGMFEDATTQADESASAMETRFKTAFNNIQLAAANLPLFVKNMGISDMTPGAVGNALYGSGVNPYYASTGGGTVTNNNNNSRSYSISAPASITVQSTDPESAASLVKDQWGTNLRDILSPIWG